MARRPPVTCTDPTWGWIRPASTLRSVVLPAPFGPKIASVWPDVRSKDTPSRATTCPRPSPKACRRPSAESIDAGGEDLQVERLDEIPRVAEVQHVDERLQADVRGRDEYRERRHRLASARQ